MKTILILNITAILLLTSGTQVSARPPAPDGDDAISHALVLLANEETALHDIVFDGPGKGSPEHKATSDRYCALQAFIRLAVHHEKDHRYKVITNPATGTEAIVDTKTGRTMLQSRQGRLTTYDRQLDTTTFVVDD